MQRFISTGKRLALWIGLAAPVAVFMAASASAELICVPTEEGESCVVIGDPVPPDPPAPPPPPDQCLADPQSCDPCAFGACDPSMMAQGDPPKRTPSPTPPKAPQFGGVTTANYGQKIEELKKLSDKITALANPKDSNKNTLNGLLIARLFVGGTPIDFVPKFGAADAMTIRFAGFSTADPTDPLAKLLLDALDCKRADASCVEAQEKQLDDRTSEIEKIKLQAQALSDNLVQCTNQGACTPTEAEKNRLQAVFEESDRTGVPKLLDLTDEAKANAGRLRATPDLPDPRIECESGGSLSFDRCRNPEENQEARDKAELERREKERERSKAPKGI